VKVEVDPTRCGDDPFFPAITPETSTMYNMLDYGFNNLMSSYTCGKNVIFDFCNGAPGDDCTGVYGGMHGGGPVRNHWVGDLSPLSTFYGTCMDPDR